MALRQKREALRATGMPWSRVKVDPGVTRLQRQLADAKAGLVSEAANQGNFGGSTEANGEHDRELGEAELLEELNTDKSLAEDVGRCVAVGIEAMYASAACGQLTNDEEAKEEKTQLCKEVSHDSHQQREEVVDGPAVRELGGVVVRLSEELKLANEALQDAIREQQVAQQLVQDCYGDSDASSSGSDDGEDY